MIENGTNNASAHAFRYDLFSAINIPNAATLAAKPTIEEPIIGSELDIAA
jgi:hypothetical protein